MSWLAKIGSAIIIFLSSVAGIFSGHSAVRVSAPQSPAPAPVSVGAVTATSSSNSQNQPAGTVSAGKSAATPAKNTPVPKPPVKTETSAPLPPVSANPASFVPGTQWFNIPGPNSSVIKTAVTWPDGQGPFPVIILLHGSEGFRQTYVTIGQKFSKSGYVTVAPCWFTGFKAPMSNFSDYLDCPNGPAFSGANLQAVKNVDAVIAYVRNLPGVKPDRIGLIGSSRGSTLSLLTASTESDIQAVVAVSAIYEYPKSGINDDLPIKFIRNLNTPVLILHGTNDSIVNIQEARDYETQLKNSGKSYQSYYEQGAPHTMLYTDPYSGDIQSRALSFFNSYLQVPAVPSGY